MSAVYAMSFTGHALRWPRTGPEAAGTGRRSSTSFPLMHAHGRGNLIATFYRSLSHRINSLVCASDLFSFFVNSFLNAAAFRKERMVNEVQVLKYKEKTERPFGYATAAVILAPALIQDLKTRGDLSLALVS